MKKSSKKALKVGAGVLTAAVLAGAAAYVLSDEKTMKKGKAKAKAWVAQAKKDVIKHAEAAKRLSAAEYAELVDQAVKRYGSLRNASAQEVMQAAKEMKGHWNRIQEHAMKASAMKPKKSATPKRKAKAKTAKKKK